jgi:prophage DNA circulation protein
MANNIKWNNWRDNLKEASFRGIPFHVLTTSQEGGRRSALHQFPFSDEPYWEDLGGEADVYHITGYVISNSKNKFDYFAERNALRDALKKEGPGTLVHPFYGMLKVGVMGKFKLDENFTEGGVARFTMTFVNAGRAVAPESTISPTGIADSACNTAIGKVNSELAKNIVVNKPGILDQAKALYNVTKDGIAKVQETILKVQAVTVSYISAAQTSLASTLYGIQSVINYPTQFANSITGIFSTYTNLIPHMPSKNTSLVDAALSLNVFGTDYSIGSLLTDSQKQELINRNAMIDAMRCGGIIEAVRAASYAEYGSAESALAMLDKLNTAIDSCMDNIGENSQNDTLYDTMRGLKPIVTSVMINKGANLPATKIVELSSDPKPSLVLAEVLYGDITREQEIIDMNPMVTRHPGFPLAGSELRVLSE